MHECVRLEDGQPLHLVCIQNCFSSVLLTPQSLFQRTDDASGGSLQTFKRWLKFRLRCFWHRPHVLAVHDHLHQLGLASVFESDPLLVVRCTRAYLWSGLAAQGRAAAQMAYLDWLVQTFSSVQASALYATHPWLLCEWTLKERHVRIMLKPGRDLAREGELELHLELDGSAVMRAAFSVLPAHMVGGTKKSQLRRRNDMRQQVQSACLAAAQARRP